MEEDCFYLTDEAFERIKVSVESGTVRIPQGLDRQARREFLQRWAQQQDVPLRIDANE